MWSSLTDFRFHARRKVYSHYRSHKRSNIIARSLLANALTEQLSTTHLSHPPQSGNNILDDGWSALKTFVRKMRNVNRSARLTESSVRNGETNLDGKTNYLFSYVTMYVRRLTFEYRIPSVTRGQHHIFHSLAIFIIVIMRCHHHIYHCCYHHVYHALLSLSHSRPNGTFFAGCSLKLPLRFGMLGESAHSKLCWQLGEPG